MKEYGLIEIITELLHYSYETEWVEFKLNWCDPEEIGEYISALSNSATLHGKDAGYLIWGVEDKTHSVVGTTFQPRQEKIGNQELESWLALHINPRIDFKIFEIEYKGKTLVVFEIQPCKQGPVRFKETEFIRIGSYKKKLKEFPEKERKLWLQLSHTPFEKGVAAVNCSSDEVLKHIDYPAYFELTNINLPDNRAGILNRLESENIIIKKASDRYDVTNLGAILFARKLEHFDTLSRKAIRVIIYDGINRIKTIKEQEGMKGYANGFDGLISYIDDQLPRNEQVGQAFRKDVKMYPEEGIRELVPNAMIHQDFSITGTGPMVEIFSNRIEFTNPGRPLIDALRFVDEPPQSRNELVAKFMRRLNICEERGSGFDKVVFACEFYQLPAPEVIVTEKHTKVILYAHKTLSEMDKKDKIRACYLHACLKCVSNERMTNGSLRERFGIEKKNNAIVSRIIAETIESKLVKPYDPESRSRKHASYIPFWA